jgi:hypothetical protein
MSKELPCFKVGDVIADAFSNPMTIEEIRIGIESDFIGNGKRVNWTGELCYISRFIYGKKNTIIFPVDFADRNFFKKGTRNLKYIINCGKKSIN